MKKKNQTVKDCKSKTYKVQIESVFVVNIVEKSFQQRKADKTKEMRLKKCTIRKEALQLSL